MDIEAGVKSEKRGLAAADQGILKPESKQQQA